MDEPAWGLVIVFYVFLAGVSAGAFAASASILLATGDRYRRSVAWGAYLAPVLVSAGTGLLVFDLGQPLRAPRLFTRLVVSSPMSFGSWFLTAFILVSILYAVTWLPQRWLRILPARLQKALEHRWAYALVRTMRRALAVLGLPLALGVGIYTGILVGVAAHPLWKLPLIPILFVVSAVSTGITAVMLCVLLTNRAAPTPESRREISILLRADLSLLLVEFAVLSLMILYSRIDDLAVRRAWDVILDGRYSQLFWIGPVLLGIVVPIAMDVVELQHEKHAAKPKKAGAVPWLSLATASCVMLGGFLLRYVVVFAGQP